MFTKDLSCRDLPSSMLSSQNTRRNLAWVFWRSDFLAAILSRPTIERHVVKRSSFRHRVLAAIGAKGEPGAFATAWTNSRARRWMDILVAIYVLIAVLPLIAMLSCLVRVSSPGPIFSRERRVGRFGKKFTYYSFRTSHIKSGQSTQIGEFLRLYKLDQLPSLWNVLRGDMSLVGPRPKVDSNEAMLTEWRPGITGVASLVFFKPEQLLSSIPHDERWVFYQHFIRPAKEQLDRDYMLSATLATDIRLLWRTVWLSLHSSPENIVTRSASTIAKYEAAQLVIYSKSQVKVEGEQRRRRHPDPQSADLEPVVPLLEVLVERL